MNQFEKVICTAYTGVTFFEGGSEDFCAYKDFLNSINMDDLGGLAYLNQNYAKDLREYARPLFLDVINGKCPFTTVDEFIEASKKMESVMPVYKQNKQENDAK